MLFKPLVEIFDFFGNSRDFIPPDLIIVFLPIEVAIQLLV